MHELQTSAVFHGFTVFLLTSGSTQRINAEHTMVDGLIELVDRLFDARSERSVQVRKFRGGGSLRGKHALRISDAGIEVFPRIEALLTTPPDGGMARSATSTGVDTLDALIAAGGVPRASATVAVGSTGTGKTTLGLHFLAHSSAEEPGLMFNFFESPDRLRAKARSFGFDLNALEAKGIVSLLWFSQGEHMLDELGHILLTEVQRRGVKRLVIDGLSGFFESVIYPERIGRFFSCLTNELRRLGVTVLMTLETRDVVSSSVSAPYGVSGFVDNLLFLRFVQNEGMVKRLITITKMRDSDFDHGLHELKITSSGMLVAGLFSSGGDVIPSAHPVPGTTPYTTSSPNDKAQQ